MVSLICIHGLVQYTDLGRVRFLRLCSWYIFILGCCHSLQIGIWYSIMVWWPPQFRFVLGFEISKDGDQTQRS